MLKCVMTTDQQTRRDVWHQSRLMWTGILSFIFGIVLVVAVGDQAGEMGTVFLVAGLVCAALYGLRKFFTRR